MNHPRTNWLAPWIWPCLTILLCTMFLVLSQSQADDIAVADQGGVTSIQHDGQLLLEYRSQPNPMKVYVSKWCTPQGTQVFAILRPTTCTTAP